MTITELQKKYNIYDKDHEIIIENLIKAITDIISGGVDIEWVNTMKTKLTYDSANQEIKSTEHIYCEGDLETDKDIVVGRDLVIDGIQNIQNTDGDPFIPESIAGKYLCGGSNFRYQLVDLPQTQEVIPISKTDYESEEFVAQVGKVYVVYENDGSCVVKYFTH